MEVTNIVGNQVFVCNTLHTTIGKIVTDSFGNEYVVSNMVMNQWMELTPHNGAPDPFNDTVVFAPPIKFLHGTPQTTNGEYLQLGQNSLDKVPLVWLIENYQYNEPEGDSAIGAVFSVVLVCLDWAKEVAWNNDQHNDLVIKPMESLARAIRDSINSDFAFRRLEDIAMKPRPRFGVEVTNKGNRQKMFNEDLSGVEMRFSLQVRDLEECC
jgi:hypothetical protein